MVFLFNRSDGSMNGGTFVGHYLVNSNRICLACKSILVREVRSHVVTKVWVPRFFPNQACLGVLTVRKRDLSGSGGPAVPP